MRVLIACEYSGIVRDAFLDLGHDAMSCDILPSESNRGGHYQGDVMDVIGDGWDMMIAHPPCTYLSYAGSRWFNEEVYGESARERKVKRLNAAEFFMALYNAPIKRVAIENPVGWMNSAFRKPDQVIQPYYFGDGHVKGTCLWLKNMPPLYHSEIDDLFAKKTHIDKPAPLAIQLRKPSKYYKGGEIKNRYFTEAATRSQKERNKTFE